MTEERTGKGQRDDGRHLADGIVTTRRTSRCSASTSPTRDHEAVEDGLTFGASDTASLPHWTEPPTGEVPRLDASADVTGCRASATTTSSTCGRRSRPNRRCGRTIADRTGAADAAPGSARVPDSTTVGRRTDASTASPSRAREPSADHDRHRSVGHAAPAPSDRPPPRRPAARAVRSAAHVRLRQPSSRNMPVAIAVGAVDRRGVPRRADVAPARRDRLITVILGLAAVEFYDKVTEKGYRPAVVPGIVGVRRGTRSPPTGSVTRAPARDRVRVHGRVGRFHRRPERRGRARCRTCRSRRSASSGSACSVRSRC